METAARRVIKYVTIDQNGPTGKFFSEETNPETEEIDWLEKQRTANKDVYKK
ncbi:hypothetical protein QLS71_014630 [Mariniflexile litorale]|uniref:Uncharacterized protein n=1 Tax=Mariniflexile litorale TaxID=3045158 RepID=A0AAU7ED98_9FLAO|nr:hypothetical protein [Mariniflexile sp. KMM 9835]MDQ8212841.1 hypothetical protein [Mariniflexile sp. KMM 9835]